MLELVLQVVVAPGLVGAATLAANRWGQWTGGLVSAFPAIVGPVLLIAAHRHGEAFAARAAAGTLLGLSALAAFALAYAHAARATRWPGALALAWVAAGSVALAAGSVAAGPLTALAVAALSLGLAHRALSPAGVAAPPATPRWDLPLRLVLTAALVVALPAAASRLGPLTGGILAALPVLASVLAVFTHARQGAAAVTALLRGMLSGMAGVVLFCVAVALLVEPAGVAPAFAPAAARALRLPAPSSSSPRASRRRSPRRPPARSGSRRRRLAPAGRRRSSLTAAPASCRHPPPWRSSTS